MRTFFGRNTLGAKPGRIASPWLPQNGQDPVPILDETMLSRQTQWILTK